MKRTLAVVLTLCVALLVTTFASAAPVLTAVGTDLGGGLFAWDVFFDGNDGLNASAAVDLKFTGDINQVPGPFAFPQHDWDDIETLSVAPFNPPGPDLVNDSYVYTGASPTQAQPTENGAGVATWGLDLPTGIDNPAGSGESASNTNGAPMWMSSGTSAGFLSEVIQVAHVVIDTTGADALATLTVTGRLARGGVTLEDQEFIFQIPEPSSIIMLSMGAFALVGLGWRRRRRA